MALPLKKTIHATAVSVTLILVALLSLGVRQYQLYRSHVEISRQTEKLLFQFAIIRERVTENLIEGQYAGLASVGAELEELNLNLAIVIENRSIDDNYKLTLANAIDLPGLILMVRKISSGPVTPEYLRQLNTEIRTLGERLILFDRVLVEHGKRELVSFQNVVIGALAMVVSLIILLLLFFQRRLVAPMLDLVRQVHEVASGARPGLSIAGTGKSGEISELAHSFRDLLMARDITAQGLAKFQRVASAVKGAQLAISRNKNRDSLFKEVCRALLSNHEYCLVWIGQLDEDGDIMPVTADGATSMSNKECEICMAVLLTEAEEKGLEQNPAALALRSKAPVVRMDILAGIPKGLLKGTPLADGNAACAALPILWQNTVYGVLSIYALSPSDFDTKEMELLEGLAGDLGLALHTMEGQQYLASRENLHIQLFEAMRVIQLSLSPSGVILNANPVFAGMTGCSAEQISGRIWRDFLVPGQADVTSDGITLLEKLRSQEGAELVFSGMTAPLRFLCRIVQARDVEGEPERLILVGYPQTCRSGAGDGEAGLQLEMIAALASGVAHEVSDLSNGLINYAQVLADEEQLKSPGQPENELVAKIIKTGERIAEIVRKFILYGQEEGPSGGEFLPVAAVLEDALLLTGYHLKSEGIQMETDLEAMPPVVPVHAQQMQQVFLGILNRMRSTLAQRFVGRDPRKKLSIVTQTVMETVQGRVFEISIMEFGAVIPPDSLPESGQGKPLPSSGWGRILAAGRRILEDHGGVLLLSGEEGKYTRITFRFPLKGD